LSLILWEIGRGVPRLALVQGIGDNLQAMDAFVFGKTNRPCLEIVYQPTNDMGRCPARFFRVFGADSLWATDQFHKVFILTQRPISEKAVTRCTLHMWGLKDSIIYICVTYAEE
jgi:hypothetical protein